jgi:hypothetical protein
MLFVGMTVSEYSSLLVHIPVLIWECEPILLGALFQGIQAKKDQLLIKVQVSRVFTTCEH